MNYGYSKSIFVGLVALALVGTAASAPTKCKYGLCALKDEGDCGYAKLGETTVHDEGYSEAIGENKDVCTYFNYEGGFSFGSLTLYHQLSDATKETLTATDGTLPGCEANTLCDVPKTVIDAAGMTGTVKGCWCEEDGCNYGCGSTNWVLYGAIIGGAVLLLIIIIVVVMKKKKTQDG